MLIPVLENLMSTIKPINEGTFESKPVIKVYGSGDIKLKINNDEVTVKKVDEYITIDSVLKDCYKDDDLKNGDMIGEFPVLKVRENIINFSGNIGKVEVKVNEVWI